MADVSTYRRCIQAYASSTGVHNLGDVRTAADAVVVANPNYWVTFADADFTAPASGSANKSKWH